MDALRFINSELFKSLKKQVLSLKIIVIQIYAMIHQIPSEGKVFTVFMV